MWPSSLRVSTGGCLGVFLGTPYSMCRHGRGLCHLRLRGQPWWAAAGLGQALQALGLPATIGPPLCLLQRGDQLKSPSVQGSAGIALQHGLGVGCGIMVRRGPATVCLWGWGPWGLMVVPITTLITRFPSPCLSHTLHAGRELFESLVFSSVHSVNFLRQSAGLFILPPVLSSQVIFFLTAY